MSVKQLSVVALKCEDEARFWGKVKQGEPTECWLWTGSKSKLGYGRFKLAGKTYQAHRVAFALRYGDSPDYSICHRCDNPSCVNPEHLFDQTALENSVEASERNRLRRSPTAAKPRKDFPLFPHARGYWAKKVRGKLEYFGRIADDPKGEAALKDWLAHKDSLLAGHGRQSADGALTVEDLADHFLTAKGSLVKTGELSPRSYADYHATGERLVRVLGRTRVVDGLGPTDFDKLRGDIAKTRGHVALGNEVQRVRSIFRFGIDQGLIEKAVRFGQGFKKPTRKTLRKAKAAAGSKMLEAAEIGKAIAAADVQMRAMILLAANAALGQSDLSSLPINAIDLRRGWLVFPRVKTGIERRCPLWPETLTAVLEAIAKRPKPKDDADAGLLFVTKYGQRWVKFNKSGTPADALGQEFSKLLTTLGIKRPGVSFYALRHAWRTIADETRDFPAIDLIMGHADNSMAAAYRERISDERLIDVATYVRGFLFPTAGAAAGEGGANNGR